MFYNVIFTPYPACCGAGHSSYFILAYQKTMSSFLLSSKIQRTGCPSPSGSGNLHARPIVRPLGGAMPTGLRKLLFNLTT